MGMKKGFITCATALGILLTFGTVTSAEENHSVVDYLSAQGENFSFKHREGLADSYDIDNYRGTAKQNLEMLNKLKEEFGEVKTTPVHRNTSTVDIPKKEVVKEEKRTITVVATAYTAYCNGCSGVTATGIDLRANPNQKVIAVDPSIIPLGSTVYVEGYGQAIAGDKGGAIKGNRIDLFMPSKGDAINFGRQTVEVTILN